MIFFWTRFQLRNFSEPAVQGSKFVAHLQSSSKVHCYPARACAARGYVIGRGVYIYISLHFFWNLNLLSPKILTFRGLF